MVLSPWFSLLSFFLLISSELLSRSVSFKSTLIKITSRKYTAMANRERGCALFAKESREDAVSRRRRRGKQSDQAGIAAEPTAQSATTLTENKKGILPSEDAAASESSIEDMFGLGNEQLRELMEQELPVPREDLVTGKELKEEERDKDKVFSLPDLSEFMKETTGVNAKENAKKEAARQAKRIDRSNVEEYNRVLLSNPFADADDTLFLEEYDIIPSIFGSGKLLGIPVPYLQTGHGILGLVILLAAFVYAPGNPLTEFPSEIRSFLKSGLAVVYSINIVLAVQAFFNARSKNLPAAFWAGKCFLLGGVAYYEVTQATDPSKINDPRVNDTPLSSDRKSKSRTERKR